MPSYDFSIKKYFKKIMCNSKIRPNCYMFLGTQSDVCNESLIEKIKLKRLSTEVHSYIDILMCLIKETES